MKSSLFLTFTWHLPMSGNPIEFFAVVIEAVICQIECQIMVIRNLRLHLNILLQLEIFPRGRIQFSNIIPFQILITILCFYVSSLIKYCLGAKNNIYKKWLFSSLPPPDAKKISISCLQYIKV